MLKRLENRLFKPYQFKVNEERDLVGNLQDFLQHLSKEYHSNMVYEVVAGRIGWSSTVAFRETFTKILDQEIKSQSTPNAIANRLFIYLDSMKELKPSPNLLKEITSFEKIMLRFEIKVSNLNLD